MTSPNTDDYSDISSKSPNPTTSLIFFLVLTSIFSIAKTYMGKLTHDPAPPGAKCEEVNVKDTANSVTMTCAYILLLIIGNYFINLNVTMAICGEVQWKNTFITTVIPWLVIFGVMNLLLTVYPAWLSPFSNTIGYLVAKLFGLETTLEKILKPNFDKDNKRTTAEEKNIGEALQHIYSDKSLIINEITEDNFCIFWNNMNGAGLFDASGATLENRIDLYNYIKLKDNVAQYIWFLLTGSLVTSIGYNYIINSECSRSVKNIEKRHEDYMDKQEQLHDESKKKKHRIYTHE
jgi:hypothetical protein